MSTCLALVAWTGNAASAAPAAAAKPVVTKVLVIMEENHSLGEMRSGMPFLYGLARTYGYATDYRALRHPSLPNYLAIAGGSTFGVTDDDSPSEHRVHGQSVFGQALAAGFTARLYAESMPKPCDVSDTDLYAVRHAPWAYFVNERASCLRGMVPSGLPAKGQLISDVKAGRLPTVGMLVPNLMHDAHDGTLKQADSWLHSWLPRILAGPDFQSGRLVVVVTADEDDDDTPANKVLTVVLAKGVSHRAVTTRLTHYSVARLYDDVAGVPRLRLAASAPSLVTAFGLHVEPSQ